MTIRSLATRCARCKCSLLTHGRFQSARRCAPGRGKKPRIRPVSVRESSHNISTRTTSLTWPHKWSHATFASETKARRSRFADAALPKRNRQSSRSGRATAARGARAAAAALIEGLRGRARSPEAHGHNVGHPGVGHRAPSRAGLTRTPAPSSRVPALRLAGDTRSKRTVPTLREASRGAE